MIFIVVILSSVTALVLYCCVRAGKQTDIDMRNLNYKSSIKDIGSIETVENRKA
ncbi:MAG: hypothetical protein ACLSFZ_11915 [Frisingicoccus sp.]